ncbi:50S ribosomal protein L10 [Chloroflexota bacterium]
METREKNRAKKTLAIDRLEDAFQNCNIAILTDYRGLTTAEMTELRRKLDEAQLKYQVVKNTMARFAAGRVGREDLLPLFQGPIAMAFSDGEVVSAAKAITDYIRANKSVMSIKGGFLSSRTLTAAEVERLATLPPREVLIAQVIGGIQSPITGLVNCLAGPVRGMMGILQARIKQLEGA